MGSSVKSAPWGYQGFGLSDLPFWVQRISTQRPLKDLKVQAIVIKGLIDREEDVSCIAGMYLPSSWPTHLTNMYPIWIGQAPNVGKSSQILIWDDAENKGTFCPYIILSIHFYLWGRDILTQMGMPLFSTNDMVSYQMLQMKYNPNKGLGKNNKKKNRKNPLW